MKILFFGDSLTKGQVGASFINLLSKRFPAGQFENRGTNGDTLNVISKKLFNHLKQWNNYDYVVLQGGGNDILLPFFKSKGGLFEFAYNTQLEKGLVSLLTSVEYYAALVELFRRMKLLYKGKIIFITLGCLSEQLDTALNKTVISFNEAAKRAAFEERVIVADVHPSFKNYLEARVQTDYLIESFWAVTIFDKVFSLFRNGITLLSRRRKLLLTIDGAHVNNEGAAIVSNLLIQIIEKGTAG